MNYFERLPLLSRGTRMIIQIKVPWYEALEVDTKYFGKYRIQLASVSGEGSTILQIAAFPIKTAQGSSQRQVVGLSGAFETQEHAIQGWENGFVVLPPEGAETPGVRDAVLKALLKKRQAQELQAA